MQNSTDMGVTRRPIILYIIIAIVLFAALILGVRWAKNRAAYYSQPQTGQNQQANSGSQPQGTTGQQPAPAAQQPQPASSSNESHPTTPAIPTPSPVASTGTPSRVPSTGPEQVFLPIISLSTAVFAGLSYWRARRRLQALAS